MCKTFSHLTTEQLNDVHDHLAAICEILNPCNETLSGLHDLGLHTAVKFEIYELEAFAELCQRAKV